MGVSEGCEQVSMELVVLSCWEKLAVEVFELLRSSPNDRLSGLEELACTLSLRRIGLGPARIDGHVVMVMKLATEGSCKRKMKTS